MIRSAAASCENAPSDHLEREFRGGGAVLWARVCLVVGT